MESAVKITFKSKQSYHKEEQIYQGAEHFFDTRRGGDRLVYCVIISSALLHRLDVFALMEDTIDACEKGRDKVLLLQIIVTGF